MATFKYKAQNQDGKHVKGTMDALDQNELHSRLKESGLYLLEVKEVVKNNHSRTLKPKILANFSRELGTLLGSGVTLVRALSIILNGESITKKERVVYSSLMTSIRSGTPLSDAMEKCNGAFPELMIYMFRSAETSGNLDHVAMKMAELYEKQYKLKQKISSSMLYPKILFAMLIGVILIMSNIVLPKLEPLLAQINDLPTLTKILFAISDFIQTKYILLFIGGFILYALFETLYSMEHVKYEVDKIKIKIPLFGKLNKVICTSRFTRTMSSLYTAGIPIVTGLAIARKTIGNAYIDQQFDEVISYVRMGNDLSDGLSKVDGFVNKMIDSIRVGEETGRLDSMLSSTAEAMEFDADQAITKLISYVEPIMLIIMGIIVALVFLGVFGAILSSYDAVAGM